MATSKGLRRPRQEQTTPSSNPAARSLLEANLPDNLQAVQNGSQNHHQQRQQSFCSLKCRNNGECLHGRPLHGFAAQLLEDEDSLRYASPYSNNNAAMYCLCPQGWTGLFCEIKLISCPEDENGDDDDDNGTCFNGDKCTLSEDDGGNLFAHCECNAIETDFALPYVTHFCGHVQTTICTTDRFQTSHDYCLNGGKCVETMGKDDPNNEQPHAACECTAGWEGPHCAHVEGTSVYSKPPPRLDQGDKLWFSLAVGCICCLLLVLALVYERKRRWRKLTVNATKNSNKQ